MKSLIAWFKNLFRREQPQASFEKEPALKESQHNAENEHMRGLKVKPHEAAKIRVELTAQKLVSLIHRDGLKVLKAISDENLRLVDDCKAGIKPKHSFVPSTAEVFAKRLYDGWTEEERQGIEVFEGYCFLAMTQWFVVAGVPEEVEEPFWYYVVDPIPSGIRVFSEDDKCLRSASIFVIAPQSPYAKNYSGQPEHVVREREKASEPQESAR
jgi:hypothetical protein